MAANRDLFDTLADGQKCASIGGHFVVFEQRMHAFTDLFKRHGGVLPAWSRQHTDSSSEAG